MYLQADQTLYVLDLVTALATLVAAIGLGLPLALAFGQSDVPVPNAIIKYTLTDHHAEEAGKPVASLTRRVTMVTPIGSSHDFLSQYGACTERMT